jgi:hypothetical protein
MTTEIRKIDASTLIPLTIVLILLSVGIFIPILTLLIFSAIIVYYINHIVKCQDIYLK